MKRITLIIVLLFQFNLFSQSKVQGFFTLSSPEKCWVVFHPFKAKKAFKITNDILQVTDSIGKTRIVGSDLNGGKLDAFKHSYWMSRLSQEIGKKAALKLGKSHEKGNYKTYKKNHLEDGYVPDKMASTMDLYNNEIGVKIGTTNLKLSKSSLININIAAIKNGEMKVIKKDVQGNFLTCRGKIITKETLLGTWDNEKCLVKSNVENTIVR